MRSLRPRGLNQATSRCCLGAVPTAEDRRLRLTYVPGFRNDRRNFRVGEEVLEALLIPVEDHPDPIGFRRIAKDGRTLGAVLLSLLGALGRKDFQEAVEILDLR